jgi:zinc-ribbon domain
MAALNYCSHCGAEVTTLRARFCKACGAALAGNEPAQIVAPQPVGVVKVLEFQYRSGYAGWLQANQGKVKVINVATKRWGLAFGFLGRAKTYTVTYEVSAETEKADEKARKEQNIVLGVTVLVIGLIVLLIWIEAQHGVLLRH